MLVFMLQTFIYLFLHLICQLSVSVSLLCIFCTYSRNTVFQEVYQYYLYEFFKFLFDLYYLFVYFFPTRF